MMNCYNNGIIYKLCCKDTTIKDIYVGSTCAFRMRKNSHKSSCTNENSKKYNLNVYKFIRDHGGWDNWDMIEIKKVNCDTKRELDKEERAVLEQLGGTLNTNIPTSTMKEIYEKRSEKFNCDCGSIIRKSGKSRHIKSEKHQKYLNSSFA